MFGHNHLPPYSLKLYHYPKLNSINLKLDPRGRHISGFEILDFFWYFTGGAGGTGGVYWCSDPKTPRLSRKYN